MVGVQKFCLNHGYMVNHSSIFQDGNVCATFVGCDKKVSALISDSKWFLNTSNLPLNTCNIINNISIHKDAYEDYRMVTSFKYWKFLQNSAWDNISIRSSNVQRRHRIWNNICAPKMSTYTYFALLNKLNTLDKVRNQNSYRSTTCVLCKRIEETRERSFCECGY